MEHYFALTVIHNNESLIFQARTVNFDHSFNVYVVINGQEVAFERDKNGQYYLASYNTSLLAMHEDLLGVIIKSLNEGRYITAKA